jgi:hypothetical protein
MSLHVSKSTPAKLFLPPTLLFHLAADYHALIGGNDVLALPFPL